MSGFFVNKPITRVWVDGSMVNIIPTLILSEVGKIVIRTGFCEIEDFNKFLIINVDAVNNALIKQLWKQNNATISSMYQQCDCEEKMG